MGQVATEAMNITNVVAIPILKAGPSFFETPKKGQRPRYLTKTMLLMRAIPRNITMNSFTLLLSPSI
ncbi:hypothetical protein ES703_121365 [subsurface metagenome]